jgi:hypothetical protein
MSSSVTGFRIGRALPLWNYDKGKSKAIPVLSLTEYHSMKAYWGSGGIAPRVL